MFIISLIYTQIFIIFSVSTYFIQKVIFYNRNTCCRSFNTKKIYWIIGLSFLFIILHNYTRLFYSPSFLILFLHFRLYWKKQNEWALKRVKRVFFNSFSYTRRKFLIYNNGGETSGLCVCLQTVLKGT